MSYYDRWYSPAPPKKVEGGIKTSGNVSKIAKNWWSKRWIQTLDSFHLGARLSRGRSYARSGQVADLKISKGIIKALVQGTRKRPYHCEIKFSQFSPDEWDLVINKLIEEPLYAADLLNGIMPPDIETFFYDSGLILFPEKYRDLETDCSCPDWSNPCKHIAAVFYVIAEAFDEDPLILFELRGMSKEDLFAKLQTVSADEDDSFAKYQDEPLPLDTESFWGKEQTLINPPVIKPKQHAAIPKKLGKIPFWRSNLIMIDYFNAIYSQASKKTLELRELMGEISEK